MRLVDASVVLYHSPCLDGFYSALAHHFCSSTAFYYTVTPSNISNFTRPSVPFLLYVPYQYDFIDKYYDELKTIIDGRNVTLLDVSITPTLRDLVLSKSKDFVWIDHHHTSLDHVPSNDLRFVLDTSHCGAVLTVQRLLQENHGDFTSLRWTNLTTLLGYVEDADLYRWNLQDSRLVHAGLSLVPHNFNDWYSQVLDVVGVVDDLRTKGSIVRQVVKESITRHLQRAVTISHRGVRASFVNVSDSRIISELLNELCTSPPPDQYGNYVSRVDFAVGWYVTPDSVVYALRSLGFDVSAVAQRFGGGGHVRAAGFTAPLTSFAPSVDPMPILEVAAGLAVRTGEYTHDRAV